MLKITLDNITEYVIEKLPFFGMHGDIVTSQIGDGTLEEDGDGFINFVFRISDGKYHLILKQASLNTRVDIPFPVDINRYKLEYESMMLRRAIVPEHVPEIYLIDKENKIFIMEDVSRLKIARFQLVKNVTYPKLADHMARYLAGNNFYTSEYYLPAEDFRNLTVHFMNHTMRNIMDNIMFNTAYDEDHPIGSQLDPAFREFSYRVCSDPKVVLSRQRLRHMYMTKGECFIHGDLHTSNIFAGPDETMVIDMEYTFCGPISYDLGYFLANIIAEFCSASFRPFDTEEERSAFKEYCLVTTRDMYLKFCDYFCSYWDEDAKPEYKNVPGLQNDFRYTTLHEFIAYAASVLLSRTVSPVGFPDFDVIEDPVAKHNAKCLCITLCKLFLNKWERYSSIDEIMKDIILTDVIFHKNVD